MLQRTIFAILILMVITPFSVAEEASEKQDAPKNIAGSWLGTLDVGALKLRLGFIIKAADDGQLSGTLISIDQGQSKLTLSNVSVEENQVILSIDRIRSKFEGKFGEGKDEIEGKWNQAGQSFPLVLKRVKQLPTQARPQNPVAPYPYLEEEVTFTNTKHQVKLAGTLTIPKAEGPFPAVILVSGSGPQDRDESLMGHQPFWILADHLTRKGIAVLRYDDRGVEKSTGTFATATSEDFAEDAQAAIDYLRSRKDIQPNQVGVIGHSEGGLIAPLLASRDDKIALIVLIAGPGVTGKEILLGQTKMLAVAMGVPAKEVEKSQRLNKEIYQIAGEETSREEALKKIDKFIEESAQDENNSIDQNTSTIIKQQMAALLSPWFRFFVTYDPQPALSQVKCPVLALIGEKDMQVDADSNIPAIQSALEKSGNKDFLVKELPGLNHLLQPCKTGMPSEYANIETTIDPKALQLIGEFVATRLQQPNN